jgi:hypothetical protein
MNNQTQRKPRIAVGFGLVFIVFAACVNKSPVAPGVTYQLTLLAGVGGTVTAPPKPTISVDSNESIVIKATSNPGYTFQKWTQTTERATITYKNARSTTVRLLSGDDTVQAVFIAASGLNPIDRATLGRVEAGVNYDYFSGVWSSLPDFTALDPDSSNSCNTFDLADVPHRPNNFGIVFTGYIDIPFKGDYTFYLKSSDGSTLALNDTILIHNDGIHSAPVESTASVNLAEGKYCITVRYFNASSSPACTVSYACPAIGIEKQILTNGILSRPYIGPLSKIFITKPAGGETYYCGDTMHVRWIYRHFDHMVFCEISLDNGKRYTQLSRNAFAHADSNGFMDWQIPVDDSLVTNQARIRIRDYPPGGNLCVSNLFSIAKR